MLDSRNPLKQARGLLAADRAPKPQTVTQPLQYTYCLYRNPDSRNRGSPQKGAAVSSTQMAMIPQRDFELFFSSLTVVTQAPANMRFGIRTG